MAQWSETQARKRATRAKGEKETADALYREAMEITFPERMTMNGATPGASKNTKNWDGQSTVSVIRSANRFSSDFTPQFSPWFELTLGPAAEEMPDRAFEALAGKTKDAARQELESVTAITRAVFQGPGFATSSHEMYVDYQYGMGGISMMPNEDLSGPPVIFTSMPLGHFWPQRGPNGIIDKWFFWIKRKADDVLKEWPDAKLPARMAEMAQLPEPPDVKLIAVCYRDYDIRDRAKKPFRYEVFWQFGKSFHRLVERQTVSPAFITPRYMVLAGENMGRGPVLFAIADIRTANKIVELTLKSASIAVAGVYTATDDGLVGEGTIRIAPASVIKVRHNGGPSGPSLQRLETPTRLDFSQLLLDQLHQNIKKVLGDNSLPPEAGPVRSATEFVQRVRELIADAAGGLGRLHSEFVVPAVQRAIDILDAKQILPAGLAVEIDQFIVQVKLTSPLAKQESLGEVKNLIQFVELLGKIGGPEMQHLVAEVDGIMAEVGDLLDVPAKFIHTKQKRTQIMASAAQVAMQQNGAPPGQVAQVGQAVHQVAGQQQNGG